MPSALATDTLATVHPSSLSCGPDEESGEREIHRFVGDFRKVAAMVT